MKSFIKKGLVSAGTFALPFLALAQSGGLDDVTSFDNLFSSLIKPLVNNLSGLIVVLAFLYFIWGLIKYIKSAGDPKEREQARSVMVYGIVIIFVMVAVWGLVGVLNNLLFGGAASTVITPPNVTTF